MATEAGASTGSDFFISRAGVDAITAVAIASILREAGHSVTIQDWDFANTSFVSKMHDALASGARVVALLSPAYLASDNCSAEWQATIAHDLLNRKRRLIVLRVAECEPTGLLAPLSYWDLVPALTRYAAIDDIVLRAIRAPAGQPTPGTDPYWRTPRTIVSAMTIGPTLGFIGRDAELSAIDAELRLSAKPVALHGLAGVGKTSIAREFARHNIDRYSIIWLVSGTTETQIVEQLAALGSRVDPSLTNTEDLVSAAESVTSGLLDRFDRPALLIFDNLEDEALLHRWRPKGAHAVVTSRNSAWSGDVSPLAVQPLGVEQAAKYLARNSGRTLSDDEALEIATALGSLPLALAHASAYLRSTKTVTVREYLERLDTHLRRLPPGAQFDRAVYATFAEAVAVADRNRPGAASLMCMISCFDLRGIPKAVFSIRQPQVVGSLHPYGIDGGGASLGEVLRDELRLAEALAELDRLSLIEYDAIGETIGVHRLVGAAARRMLVGDRLDDWAIGAVIALNASFPAPDVANWSICEQLLPHAFAALSVLPENLAFDAAGRLCNQCAIYLEDRALYQDAERLFRRAVTIALATQNSIGKPATALNNLAWFLSRRGKRDEGEKMLRQAAELATSGGGDASPELKAILVNLAVLLREGGRVKEATAVQERLAAMYAANPSASLGDTVAMNNRARIMIEAGRFEEADPILKEALALERSRHRGDHPNIAATLENIGELEASRGHITEAVEHLGQALAMLERCLGPNHPDVGNCLGRFAGVISLVQPAQAEQMYRRAIAIFEQFGDDHSRLAALLYSNLALLLESGGRRDDADSAFGRAGDVLAAGGLRRSEEAAGVLANHGTCYFQRGKWSEAEAKLRQALAVLEEARPLGHDIVGVLRMLALIATQLERTDEAKILAERAASLERCI